jgi:hypothetical protein
MLGIMVMQDTDFKEALGDTDRLIMSSELEVDFGEFHEDIQRLTIDSAGIDFICTLISASASMNQDAENRFWDFKLEVPGLSFNDLIGATNIKFRYNDNVFESISTFSWGITDLGSVLTFAAIRIFNKHESE